MKQLTTWTIYKMALKYIVYERHYGDGGNSGDTGKNSDNKYG